MASTVDVDLSRGALPVCLGNENYNRLVSLWEIVDIFRAHSLYSMLRQIEMLEASLESASKTDRVRDLTPEEMRDVSNALQFAAGELRLAKCDDLADKAERCIISLSIDRRKNTSSVATALEELWLDIDKAVQQRKFVLIRPDRAEFAECERLFGDEVYSKFENARSDITKAGNCLAIEDGTGAVFHLMRVAEYGLRALAYDREVEVPQGPLDLATWEAILKELEKAETAIQGYTKTHGREAQFKFYHGAMMELRRYKNIVRNPVMHTRDDFDRDSALSVMRHVRAFMNTLASRIGEGIRTPKEWGDDMVG